MSTKKSLDITKRAERLRAGLARTRAQIAREVDEIGALRDAEQAAWERSTAAQSALESAAEAAGISCYWRESEAGSLPEWEASKQADADYSSAYVARTDSELIRDGLAQSAADTAAAYVGEVIRANSARLEGLKPTYKRTRAFLDEVEAAADGMVSTYAYDDAVSVTVARVAGYHAGPSCRRIVDLVPIGSEDGLIHADSLPQAPMDEGATLAEIRRAVKRAHTAREEVEALRAQYVADVSKILGELSVLPPSVAEELSRSARTYF